MSRIEKFNAPWMNVRTIEPNCSIVKSLIQVCMLCNDKNGYFYKGCFSEIFVVLLR